MNEWMDGWMDGWINEQTSEYDHIKIQVKVRSF